MDRLRDEVLLNAQLAHEYKVLQTREMAVKNALAGFFETRVALQDTKAWFDRLMVMEQRMELRGSAGELLRSAVTPYIQNLSESHFPCHDDKIVDLWKMIIGENL